MGGTGFQRDIEGGLPEGFPCLVGERKQREPLGVKLSGARMVGFAQDGVIVDNNGANHWIGMGFAPSHSSQGEGVSHPE